MKPAKRRERLRAFPRPGAARAVAVGLLLGLGAIALKWPLVQVAGGDVGFTVLLTGVTLAAWYGGVPAGLTAAVTSAIGDIMLFISPDLTLVVTTRQDQARIAVFLVAAVATTIIVRSLRHSREQLVDGIAEQERLTTALIEGDRRLEHVLAASRTGTWEWDVATGDLTWSDAIFDQHGLPSEGGPPDFESYLRTIHPDDREPFQSAIADALATGGRFDLEFRILWPDGSIHWVRGAAWVFAGPDGKPARMVGTGTDITESRRLEEDRDQLRHAEVRAGQFRDAFIGIVSHELRTPITTILGSAAVLERPPSEGSAARRSELIADIRSEAERLHRLIEDLLILSRAERGPIESADEPVGLRHILAKVVATERARNPETTFELEVPPNLPVVSGDQTYVEQIVRNILANAVKYSPRGSTVTVRAGAHGGEVSVVVLDEGPGIDVAETERLFGLFYRSPEVARQVAGSGIGLFVCARLVDAMGGRIWARRRPEGGSEFGFSLVRLDDTEPVMAEDGEAPEVSPREAEPARGTA